MSQIIWDSKSLDTILLQLRKADELLTQCKHELQLACAQGMAVLQENSRASQRILQAMEYALRRSESLSEQSLWLLQSMHKVQEMIAAAEAASQKLMRGNQNNDIPQSDLLCQDVHSITTVLYANTSERVIGLVPQWLMDAANQMFR